MNDDPLFGIPELPPLTDDGNTIDDIYSGIVLPFPQVAEGLIYLGYDRAVFYYLSRATRQVHALSADQHTKKALMGMASVPHYWQRTKHISAKGNIKWDDAIDAMMSGCRDVGIYDPERVRGRGVWSDNRRAVFHMGDRLIVNGIGTNLMLPGTRSIYPAALSLNIQPAEPLPPRDAIKLKQLCEALRWEKKRYGTLFAGWIVCAMICGALKWRPSVWLTGASGSGKSWLLENVLTPLIGPIALNVMSKTTEAGIRQTLNSDALPVIFDEFESEDHTAATRVQGVLDLMRQSSSESDKKIIKGSQNQTAARGFRVRSCFIFSSVNVGVTHTADENRLSVLSLLPPATSDPEAARAFELLSNRAVDLITSEYAAGMLARAVGMVETIRGNAEVFSAAMAKRMGTRRLGDQLGTMLAGAHALWSNDICSAEFADRWLAEQDWASEWGDVIGDGEPEEERLLAHILSHRVRVQTMHTVNGREVTVNVEVTLGRLVAATHDPDDVIDYQTAYAELRDYGLRMEPPKPATETEPETERALLVSTNHPALARILRDTPWHANWSRSLGRIKGATSLRKNVRFSPGISGKATRIPYDLLVEAEV